MEEIDIIIVGGGICGLATALAFHRKGIKSVVFEKSESLRATGAGITIRTNGWRALDQLGVGSKLRKTALPVKGIGAETRCLRRSDLITSLAESLPHGTVHLGCQILSVTQDSPTSYPIIQLQNGSVIKAKVLIGCDGANSVVADFLGLKPPKFFSLSEVRGFTEYPSGHDFNNEFVQVWGENSIIGRIPMDNKLVYWFVTQKMNTKGTGSMVAKDPELIHQRTLESIKDFPTELIGMIRNCDRESVSWARLRHRAPWDILLGSFQKGTVAVAGDAMHVMGPFLGQGGAACIEDAIVLARCLAQKMHEIDAKTKERLVIMHKVGEGLDQYVKERRMRLVWLTTQTYLCSLLVETPGLLVELLCTILLMVLFRDSTAHTQYDCGRL
ncbi:3-hydroxybenzoate 6-hydroxylase 1 [Morella rubra]|uniref:3-hydroxybenzoate 6-hydroxylase 1 n=1 Tax=Morella rubra TaxID=262757 RepID=A0A6A1VGS1_9ROSI|nr:3-hydroxybenzoate 6-hydroxylase 1 [Morella rubra]